MVRAGELAWVLGSTTGQDLLGSPFFPASPFPSWLPALLLLLTESHVLSPNSGVRFVIFMTDSFLETPRHPPPTPRPPSFQMTHFDRYFLKTKTQLIKNCEEMCVTPIDRPWIICGDTKLY